MFGWGRNNNQNSLQSLRQQQINELKRNPSIITLTENSLYECRFKTRNGPDSFLIELPPMFPNVAPRMKFRQGVNHPLVPGADKITIHSQKLAAWGPQTSIHTVINECLVQFVSNPPQRIQVQQNPPPPSFNQFQHQNQGGYRPPQQQYNQARPYGAAPGYQPPPPQFQQNRPPGGPSAYNANTNYAAMPVPNPQYGGRQDSTHSNVSANSNQEEEEENIEKLTFPCPQKFEIVQSFQRDELQQYLQNEQGLKDLVMDCPEYRQARSIMDETRKTLREKTEKNLDREPAITKEQERLEQARAEVAAHQHELDTLKKRRERVAQKFSINSIEAELDQAIMETADECAQLKESFENEEIKVVKYVNQLVNLKKLSHIRQIKKSRISSLRGVR